MIFILVINIDYSGVSEESTVGGEEPLAEDKKIHPSEKADQDDDSNDDFEDQTWNSTWEIESVCSFHYDTNGHVGHSEDHGHLHLDVVVELKALVR